MKVIELSSVDGSNCDGDYVPDTATSSDGCSSDEDSDHILSTVNEPHCKIASQTVSESSEEREKTYRMC